MHGIADTSRRCSRRQPPRADRAGRGLNVGVEEHEQVSLRPLGTGPAGMPCPTNPRALGRHHGHTGGAAAAVPSVDRSSTTTTS